MAWITVTLNDTELAVCAKLSWERIWRNTKAKVVEQKKGEQAAWETVFHGACAEYAYAKAFNLYPDFTTHPRSGGVELLSRKQLKVDVKQTPNPKGRLLVKLGVEPGEADFYVLVTGVPPTFHIRGYAYSQEIIDEKNIIDLGHGPTYALEQDKLHSYKPESAYQALIDDTREPK